MVRKATPSNKYSICTLRVTVINVNNQALRFDAPLYTVDVPEDTPPLTVIYRVTANNQGRGDSSTILYRIDGPPRRQLFMVKENTGEILLRSKLDRETHADHRITIIATDARIPGRSSSTLLLINVIDVNDNEPYFGQLEYHGYIIRGYPPGTKLIQVKAYDDDGPRGDALIQHNWCISKNPKLRIEVAGIFIVRMCTYPTNMGSPSQSSGGQPSQLTASNINVGAKDNGGLLSRNNATVHLWLLDSMEHVPKFSKNNNWSIELNENSSPERVLTTFTLDSPKFEVFSEF
ncbi:unnamed protein product [Gongylonema pulchrum]|uniref:CA domain-containing protein n=1 Tax=Gongylonema pulchrum TaxID=637853 RepID=A0A183EUP2_9BILA|nr:unnamed protein product [Gongylonema pulchrum]